jgi:hypothetical protein
VRPARKLVEIARDLTCAQGRAYTGVTNTAFSRAGGSVVEYGAGITHGIAHGCSRSIHPALGSRSWKRQKARRHEGTGLYN